MAPGKEDGLGMTDGADAKRRVVAYSTSHRAEIEDYPIPDIDRNAEFLDFFARSRQFTMTSKEVMYSTYMAARHVVERGIPGDMYESTIEPLRHLYDRIPAGGWVVVDDYHVVPSAKAALHDFLDARGDKPIMREIDGVGVFFRKTESLHGLGS
jgi:hypothetical protein